MSAEKNRKLYIVLTRSGLPVSKMMDRFNMGYYTHACIAFDKKLKRMYSFGNLFINDPFHTGLKRENFLTGFYLKLTDMPVVMLEIKVTPAQYCGVCKSLHYFRDNYQKFSFNIVGMFNRLFNIDREREGKFFCSQFVYAILNKFEITEFNKPAHFVLPDDFLKLAYSNVIFEGKIGDLQELIKD